jgi:ATP-dependent Zn protease
MSNNNIEIDTALGTYFTHNPTGILNYNSTNDTYESAGKNDIILTPKSASELELQKALENKIDCSKNSNVEKYFNYNNEYRNNYRNNYNNKFLKYKKNSTFIFIITLIIIILILIYIFIFINL